MLRLGEQDKESNRMTLRRVHSYELRACNMIRQIIRSWTRGEGQRMAAALVLVCLGALGGGCATTEKKGPTYAEQVMNRPLPVTEGEKQQECCWLRGEIARQRALGGYGSAMQDLATLESRASKAGCVALRTDAQTGAPPASGSNYDTCYMRCKQFTNKSNDVCFDLCTK
jgi:hypothetical protein